MNMNIELEGYVIYNEESKLFSRGGMSGLCGSKPKIWRKINHVKNHLNFYISRRSFIEEDGNLVFANGNITFEIKYPYYDSNWNVHALIDSTIEFNVKEYLVEKIKKTIDHLKTRPYYKDKKLVFNDV